MTWAETHEEEMIELWREGRERYGDDIAQEAYLSLLQMNAKNMRKAYFFKCGKLWKGRYDDTRLRDDRKDAREMRGVSTVDEKGQVTEIAETLSYDVTPEAIAIARDELRRVPERVLQAVVRGDYGGHNRTRAEDALCKNGHSLQEHGNWVRKGPGKVIRRCRVCQKEAYKKTMDNLTPEQRQAIRERSSRAQRKRYYEERGWDTGDGTGDYYHGRQEQTRDDKGRYVKEVA